MSPSDPPESPEEGARSFLDESRNAPAQAGIVSEFLSFLKHNKKWWLLPIVIVLLLVGLLVLLGGSVVAPLIYPLF